MALLPLIYPSTSATAYFGGIRISIWTWSCTICPSMIVLPRCPANSRNTGPKNFRILPYNAFFRPFGINTTWYLQSHFEWLRLSYDDVVIQFAPVDRQALSEHTTTSFSTKSLGQALRVSLVKPGAYLSESYGYRSKTAEQLPVNRSLMDH